MDYRSLRRCSCLSSYACYLPLDYHPLIFSSLPFIPRLAPFVLSFDPSWAALFLTRLFHPRILYLALRM